MKCDATVIEHLNRVLKNELTAINQYFLHSRMLKDWGLHKLGDSEYQESVDETKHADTLIERTLCLEGLPNLQDLGKLRVGENVPETLQCDLDLELDEIPDLKVAIANCENHKDFVSRDIFDGILKSEEDHVDWPETQLDLIKKMGLENYVQSQMWQKQPLLRSLLHDCPHENPVHSCRRICHDPAPKRANVPGSESLTASVRSAARHISSASASNRPFSVHSLVPRTSSFSYPRISHSSKRITPFQVVVLSSPKVASTMSGGS